MPDQQRRLEGIQVHTDLAEAALECGFALLRLARAHSQAGVRGDAERALQEADAACDESGRRLFGLAGGDARRLRGRLADLRSAVEAAKHGGVAAPCGGQILQMPFRGPAQAQKKPARG